MRKPVSIKHRVTGEVTNCGSISLAAGLIGMTRGNLSRKFNEANPKDITSNSFYCGKYEVSLCVKEVRDVYRKSK